MSNANVDRESLVSLTANIVTANVSNNPMGVDDLCGMILSVHSALSSISSPQAIAEEQNRERGPAVPVEDSVGQDYIICLEDGKKLKTLKRYLRAKFQMSPEDYRAKWGLPPEYPMAAPSYTAQRKEMAHKIGLGLRRNAEVTKSGGRRRGVKTEASASLGGRRRKDSA